MMNSNQRLSKSVFYVSVVSSVYCLLLVYWSYYPPQATGTLQFFGELLTIPLLLGLLGSFFYSLIQVLRRKSLKTNLATFIISLVTISALVMVTIIQTQD